ncbi:39246_t:CDS:2 [Gigaspora margarita]|uniref:39246_t:CDS:1 n=1 Tax=Gigaspora margarita TaxID=4874 RepID=A0ABN7W6Z4_GIGMA|nr:39246_t:CDS:2 [Gigaspora margarita]
MPDWTNEEVDWNENKNRELNDDKYITEYEWEEEILAIWARQTEHHKLTVWSREPSIRLEFEVDDNWNAITHHPDQSWTTEPSKDLIANMDIDPKE